MATATETTTVNRLQMKALLLNTITELKFHRALAPNFMTVKNQFKRLAGLPKNSDNRTVLKALQNLYRDNNLVEEFDTTISRFNAHQYLA